MKKLSVRRINAHSPYLVKMEDANSFCFITDNDVHYQVTLSKDESIWSDGAVELHLYKLNDKPSPHDRKLRDTILCIAEEFFVSNSSGILLYTFDVRDNRQYTRNQLFYRWFFDSENLKTNCVIRTSLIEAIIVQRSNPNFKSIISDFDRYLSYFGLKAQSNYEL